MDTRIRTLRVGIIAALLSLVGLAFIQVMTASLGVPSLPSRLLTMAIVADCVAVCFFLWMMWRMRKKRPQANAVRGGGRAVYPWKALAQTLGLIAIFETFVCGIISIAFGISLKAMWEPYLFFFAPFFAGFPLILHARQFFDRPKLCAFWLALGFSVSFVLMMMASFYSGVVNWVFEGTATTSGLAFTLIFGVIVVSVAACYVVSKRMTSKDRSS